MSVILQVEFEASSLKKENIHKHQKNLDQIYQKLNDLVVRYRYGMVLHNLSYRNCYRGVDVA